MIKIVGWAIGAAMLTGLGASGAGAMPLAPVTTVQGEPTVTLVRDGCGPGGFRGRFGDCRYGGGYGRGYGGGYGRGPGFYGPPRAYGGYGRRCFIRETYYGPRRVCRW